MIALKLLSVFISIVYLVVAEFRKIEAERTLPNTWDATN